MRHVGNDTGEERALANAAYPETVIDDGGAGLCSNSYCMIWYDGTMDELRVWKMSLERQLLIDGTTMIDTISFDPSRGLVVIRLVSPYPETWGRRTTIIFEDVHEYRAEWHSEESRQLCLIGGDNLIGLDEYTSPSGTRYVIATTDRKVSFVSAVRPTTWPLVEAA